jgi:hypothetical protein
MVKSTTCSSVRSGQRQSLTIFLAAFLTSLLYRLGADFSIFIAFTWPYSVNKK